jgi:hypothetical protein
VFGGLGETLTIRHDTISREAFVPGVLLALERVRDLRTGSPWGSTPSVITFVVGDLTEQRVDAIVNAANEALVAAAGVCGAIRRAGGDEIFEECAHLGGCATATRRRQGPGACPRGASFTPSARSGVGRAR